MNAVNMLNWAPRVGFICVGSPRRVLIFRCVFFCFEFSLFGAELALAKFLNDDDDLRPNSNAFIIHYRILIGPQGNGLQSLTKYIKPIVNWSQMSNTSDGISKQSGGFRSSGWCVSNDCQSFVICSLAGFSPLRWWSLRGINLPGPTGCRGHWRR